MNTNKKIITNGKLNLKVILNPKEVYPNDPGMGTPEMVFLLSGNQEIGSSTLACALGEGEILLYNDSSKSLDKDQIEFLEKCDEISQKYLWKNN